LRPRFHERPRSATTTTPAIAIKPPHSVASPRALVDAYLQRSVLMRVSRHEVASPLTYYFVHAKGETRPEVLASIDRMHAASYANAAVLRQ